MFCPKCSGIQEVIKIHENNLNNPRLCDVKCLKCGFEVFYQAYDFGRSLNLVLGNDFVFPNEKMLNGIIFSIKPKYNKLIIEGKKIFEYRNYVPKDFNGYFWVYETLPIKRLKYLMKVDFPIAYPNKLDGDSYGVRRFNDGEMGSKYAYKIKEVYLMKEPLELDFLKREFKFVPPQAYTYLDKNKELKKFIADKVKLERIV